MTLNRSLSLLADGHPVAQGCRIHVKGTHTLSLEPDCFFAEVWNPAEASLSLLRQAKTLTVISGTETLATGEIADLVPRTAAEGTVLSVTFALGLSFWDAAVSLSVPAGVPVSETVRRLLANSGCGVSLLSFPGEDPVLARGQAFHGRAADAIQAALSACGGQGYLVPAGLCVLPAGGVPTGLYLSERELLDPPVRIRGGAFVCRTAPAGWPIGVRTEARLGTEAARGVMTEHAIDADNVSGPWQSEVLLEEPGRGALWM